MLVDIIREIFNFPINADEVVDELIFLYEKESNKKEDNKNEEKLKNTKIFLYEILSDLSYIDGWKSVKSINIDRLISRIDRKIEELRAAGLYVG